MKLCLAEELEACDARAARVVQALDRWAAKYEGHVTERRAAVRQSFHSCLLAYVPGIAAGGRSAEWVPIKITTRNISTLGIGLVYHAQLLREKIALFFDDATCVLGDVVRQRRVYDGYWDIGVQFTERFDNVQDRDALLAEIQLRH